MVDGAHNTHSASSVVQAINDMRRRDILKIDRVILIFGVLSGHDSVGVLQQFESLASLTVPVRSRHPRSSPSGLIRDQAQKLGMSLVKPNGEMESVGDGVELALSIAGANDLVLGTGSISVAAEVIEWKQNIDPEIYSNIPTGL